MYLTREFTPLSFPSIGLAFNRHHTTVMLSVRQIDSLLIKRDPIVTAAVAACRDRLLNPGQVMPRSKAPSWESPMKSLTPAIATNSLRWMATTDKRCNSSSERATIIRATWAKPDPEPLSKSSGGLIWSNSATSTDRFRARKRKP